MFALEAKPNEPRGDIYLPTTGAMLGFIATLDHPEMVGVNPEVAHEHMAGLNFLHAVAQAWDAGKLFHIDLNDQAFGRYDQDFRFGSHSLKQAFFLVKFLEDVGYAGSRHFDAHAYRTRGPRRRQGLRPRVACGRTCILKERARSGTRPRDPGADRRSRRRCPACRGAATSYSRERAAALKAQPFDARDARRRAALAYERLDQLTVEILLGARA